MDDLDFLDFPTPPAKPTAPKPNPIAAYRTAIDKVDEKQAAALLEGAVAAQRLHDALNANAAHIGCADCGEQRELNARGLCCVCGADENADADAVGLGDAEGARHFGCGGCGTFENLNSDGVCPACAAPVDPVEAFVKTIERDEVIPAAVRETMASVTSYGPIVPPDAAPPEQPVAREDKPIDRLGLPSAAVKVLMRNGFETLGDLRARRLDLPSLRGIGSKSLDAITAALDADSSTTSGVDAGVGGDVTRTVVVCALPVVVTIGSLAMLEAPDTACILDLDDIVGDAPNAAEVIAAFLASTPFEALAPTRLHARSAAPYVEALCDWARATGVMVFKNA